MAVGRPPKYKTAQEMQDKIDEYFETQVWSKPYLDKEGNVLTTKTGKPVMDIKPPTVAGLSLFLDFSDRASMYDYKKKEKFTHIIKRAVSKIEEFAEIQLTQGNSTGAIFWLKNHGWIDKINKDLTSDGKELQPANIVVNTQLKKQGE
jgi:hypothetical protein